MIQMSLINSVVGCTDASGRKVRQGSGQSQLSRIGSNPATDDRVKTGQLPLSVRTCSAFAMHVNSQESQPSIRGGHGAGSLGSAAVREWALREVVGTTAAMAV